MAALGPLLFATVAVIARLRPMGGRAVGLQIHTPLLEDDEELSPRALHDSDPEEGSFALRKLRNGSATAAANTSAAAAASPAAPTAAPLLAMAAEEEDELGLH